MPVTNIFDENFFKDMLQYKKLFESIVYCM